jgi:probable HAF family extracellular repeat protein
MDLGDFGGTYSIPTGLNDAAQVVGYANTASHNHHGFLWSRSGGMLDLNTLTGEVEGIYPADINNSGKVVGGCHSISEGFVFERSTGLNLLGTLGHPASGAATVNEAGEVAGWVGQPGMFGYSIGFRWNSGEGMTQLDAFAPAFDINNLGQIVGRSDQDTALFWDPDTGLHDLGTLPGDDVSYASDINDSGQVVGWSGEEVSGQVTDWRPFLWDNGGMTPLGPIPAAGKIQNGSLAINNLGEIVGSAFSYEAAEIIPFIWQDGTLVNLNDLLDPSVPWTITAVADINIRGQIVATSSFVNGESDALLLTKRTGTPMPVNYAATGLAKSEPSAQTSPAGIMGGVFYNLMARSTDGAISVYAVDVDVDDDMDVLSASVLDDKIAWYENDGSQNFTTYTITASAASQPVSAFASDVNGDGDMDLLSASIDDDKIAWYENDGSQNFSTGAPRWRSLRSATISK